MKKTKLLSFLLIFLLVVQSIVISASGLTESNMKKVVSGQNRSFFITKDGYVYASGSNANGMAGLGDFVLSTNTPMKVPYVSSIVDVAAGVDETYFITDKGDVYVTGVGIEISKTPVKVNGLDNVKKIAINGNSVVILKKSGEVYIYGDNSNGQLGGGSNAMYNTPVRLSGVYNVKDVQMGDNFSVFLFENGTVKATGLDVNGRLGLGNPNSKTTTVRYLQTVPTTVEISEIAVGRSHVLYLGKNKVLYGTGEQANHLKALAGTKGMNNVTELQEFGSEIAEIASSYGSFVLLQDGTLWTAGQNEYGELLTGDNLDIINGFKQVASQISELYVGGNQTFVVMNNGELKAAGKNINGELGLGNNNNVYTPQTIDNTHFPSNGGEASQNQDGGNEESNVNNLVQGGTIDFTYAALVDSGLELDPSAKIFGNSAINKGVMDIDNNGGSNILGEVYLGPNATFKTNAISTIVKKPLHPTISFYRDLSIPAMPSLITKDNLNVGQWPTQNVTIDSNGYYDTINIVYGGNLTIDVTDGDRYIGVRNLNLQQGFIKLNGNGTLYLYLDKPISGSGSSTINKDGDYTKVQIYVKESGTFNIEGNQRINAQLYAPSASFNVSNSSVFKGTAVIGGSSVTFTGNSPFIGGLYAPNARVQLTGSSKIVGAIIADKYYSSGGSILEYAPYSVTLPGYVEPEEPQEPEVPEVPDIPDIPEEPDPNFDDIDRGPIGDLDYELIVNVAKDGTKEFGASLSAYQKMLEHVDSSNLNKSLKRTKEILEIFGQDYTPNLRYGTYNFYEEIKHFD